jgi:phosphomethylpyrimidine synthase
MPHRTAFSADADCRTQMHLARHGVVSPEMVRVAEREALPAELVRDEVARGRIIIPANVHRTALDPMAIGLRGALGVLGYLLAAGRGATTSAQSTAERAHG